MERQSQRKLSSTIACNGQNAAHGRRRMTWAQARLSGCYVNWQNTTLIVLLITLAVAVVVGSLARQLLGSIFELDEDSKRSESVSSDSQRPTHALRSVFHAQRADSPRRASRRFLRAPRDL